MFDVRSKQYHWLDVLIKFSAVSAAVYFFSFVTADPDLWGHIRFGKDLWRAKQFVHVDPYSFTADGYPWINHEWLAELLFYAVYHYFGDAGLLIGKLGIGVCIVMLLSRLCRYRASVPLVYVIVMILSISVISPGFMIRPQIFSFLFFTLFFYLFYLYFETGKNYLFLLPFLMVVWVNLHGGFLIGWVFAAIVVTWKTSTCLISKKNESHLRSLWIWFLLTSLAIFLNPYGYKLLLFLYNSLSIHRDIGEWDPVSLWDLSYLNLKILIVLCFVTFLITKSETKGWEIIFIGMTLIAALRHQRHTPFFGIIVVPYLVFGLSTIVQNIHKKFPKLTLTRASRNILAIFLCLLIGYLIYQSTIKYHAANYRIIVDPNVYPVNAVRFIRLNKIEGNLFVSFDWGEYAIWKLYPSCKVSIDGRFRTVYPEAVIRDHFKAHDDTNGWKDSIGKYSSDILLVPQVPFFQKLIKKQGEWIYVYSDSTAIVFLRNNKKNRTVLDRFKSGKFDYPRSAPSVYFP